MENYENQTAVYEGYDDLKLYSDESSVTTILKGIAGAIIGVLPGMLLWIILGKLGFVASSVGLLMAGGIVFGYTYMTKKGEVPIAISIVICAVVMIASIYLAERIGWTWELAELFKDELPAFKDSIYSDVIAEYPGITRAEIDEAWGVNWFEEMLTEDLGFSTPTFGNCFKNFSGLLEYLEVKSDFVISLVKSYAFGLVGGLAIFAKFRK